MNKVLIGLNAVLLAAVGFLFYKVFATQPAEVKKEEATGEVPAAKAAPAIEQKSTAPTGKIAYINIDRLNEECLEIKDLTDEFKRRRMSLEAGMEKLNMEYQNKLQEYQSSAKAGIAPENEMAAKAHYIESLEKQAQNKQLQMENLTADLSQKNDDFQRNVKAILVDWNNGRFDYILSYSDALPTMLLGNASLEITNEVIAEINTRYKASKNIKK